MIIILCLYLVALWAVFSKFKLVRWGWLSGTISLIIGGFILATFLALFNYLTPSGRVTVTGRVVEVTPNVTEQIVAIPVKPNVPVKKNDVLFQIDPAPFQYKVTQLQASLAAAKQQVEILKSNYEQATANVSGLTTQVAFNKQRNADIQKLAAEGANTQFQAQDNQNQYETALAQLNAGQGNAAECQARDGFRDRRRQHHGRAASGAARQKWELSQTAVRAPADGYVTVVALAVGDRALQARSAMSFIVENEITLVGMFSQNGFQTIKEGTAVEIVFDNAPGRIYHAKIIAIPKGIGQGQIAVSGALARTNALGGATVFPAEISIPDGMNRDSLRLGMSGSATAFAGNAGVIGVLASILVWVSSYTAYL